MRLSRGRTRELRIFVEDGRLHAQPAGQAPARMLYEGNDAFRLAMLGEIRLVFTLEGGRAAAVTIHQNGGVFRGLRTR